MTRILIPDFISVLSVALLVLQLAAPRENLVTIHWPDLSNVEVEVREQLLKEQASLTAAVKVVGASDATLSEAYGSMGQTFHAYSFNAPARECYVNASRLSSQDFRWFYLMAKLDQQDGRMFEAIKNYLIAQSMNPSYVAASISLGNIFLETNHPSEARKHFSEALKIDKDSPAAHYGLGQAALSERNYAEAVTYFERTLAIVPGANRVHYSLAMAYRGLGELEKAKANLRLQGTVGVRVADPLVDRLEEIVQGERLHLIRGRLALEAKRYTEAADEFRKAIAARPESVTGHLNLGAVLTFQKDVPGAIEQFEAVLRIAPENENAHYNLGVLLANQNRHQEAIPHLQAVLKSNPRDSSARVLLAQSYLRTEQNNQALGEFARIVEAEPGNEQALLGQVQALLKLGRCAEALEWQKKLIDSAERQGKTSVAESLKRDLQLYERSPCKPPLD